MSECADIPDIKELDTFDLKVLEAFRGGLGRRYLRSTWGPGLRQLGYVAGFMHGLAVFIHFVEFERDGLGTDGTGDQRLRGFRSAAVAPFWGYGIRGDHPLYALSVFFHGTPELIDYGEKIVGIGRRHGFGAEFADSILQTA